jgi:hypothetical protein
MSAWTPEAQERVSLSWLREKGDDGVAGPGNLSFSPGRFPEERARGREVVKDMIARGLIYTEPREFGGTMAFLTVAGGFYLDELERAHLARCHALACAPVGPSQVSEQPGGAP